MSLDLLVEIVHSRSIEKWTERNKAAYEGLFGGQSGRYSKQAEKATALRAPEKVGDAGVLFAAYIAPDQPSSGPYSGMSFVIFPVPEGPCLVGLGVGTLGLPPDEAILGRPGHARKVAAIVDWLNDTFKANGRVAWSKHDPTWVDIEVPLAVQREWNLYATVFKRYGSVMYALFTPTTDRAATKLAITAMLDMMMEERGFGLLAGPAQDAANVRQRWFSHLMPTVTLDEVEHLLKQRRYVVLQGPPGTGKTRIAESLLRDRFEGFGKTIQFHPNTSYETFIGGLAPSNSKDQLGLHFQPKPGFLMEAAIAALKQPDKPYLLHIDELNRADLGKVLGEAILLLEWNAPQSRYVELPYDFGEPLRNRLELPRNLYIVGTMNTADRSIAVVDVAVRRRFGFLSLWPDVQVVRDLSCPLMQKAFEDLLSIFIEYAGDDAFQLMPGHAYFLDADETSAKEHLKTNLVPLLTEYLSQGYVGGFSEPVRTYLQWLRGL